MDRSSFTKRLSELMKERGWTGYCLSKKSGVAKSTIYRVLNGTTEVKYETMRRLIDAFEIPEPNFWGYTIQLDQINEQQMTMLELSNKCDKQQLDRVIAYMQGLISQKNI